MDIKTLNLNELKIGQVFTPIKWARWLIDQWDVFDAWIDGASICDPTAGQGVFILSMLHIARDKNIDITDNMLSRLALIEINPSLLNTFVQNVKQDFNIKFPRNRIFCQDIITDKHNEVYDIVIGNPPWSNFCDLPTEYKNYLKPYFIHNQLIPDTQKVLLGSSRIDISALVLKTVLGNIVKEHGNGYFYIPTSLFFGEGAHDGFRNYTAVQSKELFDTYIDFSIETVFEFTSTKVFENINTSYCCAKFQTGKQQSFPVKYFKEIDDNWIEHKAVPLKNNADPWRVAKNKHDLDIGNSIKIRLHANQKPRQGVNTCGVNDVFIFDHKPKYLPDVFLYPLATKDLWNNDSSPCKWILLPYNTQTGKPLTWDEINQYNNLSEYLDKNQNLLKNRKGVFIESYIKKGIWWSLLGVGHYSFSPFKVIWESYGRDYFKPIILSNINNQSWQGNQSMHSYIPCWNERNALDIKHGLLNPDIPILLKQLNGAGKCNWAQPGKMKKILSFE